MRRRTPAPAHNERFPETTMRRLLILCGAVAFVGCAKADEANDEAGAAAPATISLADVAGRWTVQAMGEASDSLLTTYELNASADAAGWTMTFPGRAPIPARVSVSGDSIMVDVGPYESVLRNGMMVTTTSVSRLMNGVLVGRFVARYTTVTGATTAGADSVLRGRSRGTRVQ